MEMYQENERELGTRKAKLKIVVDILLLFRPGIIRSRRPSQKPLNMHLIKHSLTISLRSFKRYPTSFAINLLGLTTTGLSLRFQVCSF